MCVGMCVHVLMYECMPVSPYLCASKVSISCVPIVCGDLPICNTCIGLNLNELLSEWGGRVCVSTIFIK